ncbi:hypothetical protein V2J09_002924 [Rumex salicifolius]
MDSASGSMMVGFGNNHSIVSDNGLWQSSSSASNQNHGMMMMMMPSYHQHNHDDPALPPLPPSTSNFIGGGSGGSGDATTALLMGSFQQAHEIIKTNNSDNNNSSNGVANSTGYYFMSPSSHHAGDGSSGNASSIKDKILSHPHYPRLLSAYVNCQKVGAPPEMLKRLEEAAEAVGVVRSRASGGCGSGGGYLGEDPALDQFMEAYCEMLSKYEQELTKPFKEAMIFLSKIESQFKALSLASSSSLHSPPAYGESVDMNGSPELEIDMNSSFMDPQAEDKELKCQLLRKYSGYLGSLKQEFMKKRKKGKLPKEARQMLLDWWSRHYKWPYPSESQKLALAEATGLDQKQINNWFINQRKRHWKPSEDMQFVVIDHHANVHPHPHNLYMDAVLGNNHNHQYPMDMTPALL